MNVTSGYYKAGLISMRRHGASTGQPDLKSRPDLFSIKTCLG